MEESTLREGIGMVAAFLTTLSFLPQVIKTWRSRSAHDLSLGMFSMLVIGVALWLVYGIWLANWPIILANGVTLLFSGTILYFKLRYPK
ncbi:MAG: SemiSWEET transporter [Bacteroidota bacterium]